MAGGGSALSTTVFPGPSLQLCPPHLSTVTTLPCDEGVAATTTATATTADVHRVINKSPTTIDQQSSFSQVFIKSLTVS